MMAEKSRRYDGKRSRKYLDYVLAFSRVVPGGILKAMFILSLSR